MHADASSDVSPNVCAQNVTKTTLNWLKYIYFDIIIITKRNNYEEEKYVPKYELLLISLN